VPLQVIDVDGIAMPLYVAANVVVLKSPSVVVTVTVVEPVALVAEENANTGGVASTKTVYVKLGETLLRESVALSVIVVRPTGSVAARLQVIELPGVTTADCSEPAPIL